MRKFQFTSDSKSQKKEFKPSQSQFSKAFVPIPHDKEFGSRSHITLGYTPKRYVTKERS